jgi:hypothetical protein
MFDRIVYQTTNGPGNIKPAQATILARQRGLRQSGGFYQGNLVLGVIISQPKTKAL